MNYGLRTRLPALLRKVGAGFRMLAGRDATSIRGILGGLYLRGSGCEIGALDNPMPVPRGVVVRYVDRMPKEDLVRQYPEMAGRKLVDVDIVADGERLDVLAENSQDFIIANHFLEHCENPFGTLRNFLRVVKPHGVLFLAIPDKRRTFDVNRGVTTYEHLIEDDRNGPAGSRNSHFEDWVVHVERLEDEGERAAKRQALMEMGYSIHFHVFTAPGFLGILERFRREERPGFEIIAFMENGEEFICVLRKAPAVQESA